MKQLILICLLIVSVTFISGCTSDEQASSEISTSSQSNQESDTQNPELIIKQSDVPGFSLDIYHYYAIQKSVSMNDIPDNMGLNNFNLISGRERDSIKGIPLSRYNDKLPIGLRNCGEVSCWSDDSGRKVIVRILNFDSNSNFEEYFNNYNSYLLDDYNWIVDDYNFRLINCYDDNSVGDFSKICEFKSANKDIVSIFIEFSHENYIILVDVIDEGDLTKKEVIRIGEIIESRLD